MCSFSPPSTDNISFGKKICFDDMKCKISNFFKDLPVQNF